MANTELKLRLKNVARKIFIASSVLSESHPEIEERDKLTVEDGNYIFDLADILDKIEVEETV